MQHATHSSGWPIRYRALMVIFAVSGFAGIIYESVWTHYLKLFLGHAAYAQALVLAIFMGGMAIGAWTVSRLTLRWDNLLRMYAAAELLIGVLGLLFHTVFTSVQSFSFDRVLPALGSDTAVQLYKWSVATSLVLPQSVLLGMTFPLMAGGILRMRPSISGASLASLYFGNSLGAAVGILVSGFVFIAWAGLPGTIMTAAVINVLIAAAVWLIAADAGKPLRAQATTTTAPPRTDSKGLLALCLLVAALTGAASFYYEMAWIRMLGLVLGTSTHAFELMLSAFILGLSLGGLWIRRRIDGIGNPVRFLARVQVAMAVLALGTLWFYGDLFRAMRFVLGVVEANAEGYIIFNLFSHALAMLIMIPATFCAGMTLPLITNLLVRESYGEKSIGAVYSFNTLGAIVAVVTAIHMTLPLLGVKGTVLFGAAIDLAAGLLLLKWQAEKPFAADTVLAAGGGLAMLALAAGLAQLDPMQLASGVYRHGRDALPADTRMIYYRDGKTSSVSLYERSDGVRVITSNGKPDAGIQTRADGPITGDEITMTMAAVLPSAFHPTAATVANIGIGSGLTTHALLANPGFERVDTIEIERAMVEAARLYGPLVARAFDDPRSHIHVEDAKTFMANHNARYDVIVSEPSNPWVSGVSSLFTDEFYANVRTRLAPGGVLVQWLQIYEFDVELIVSVLKALSRNFADFEIYNTTSFDLLVIASPDRGLNKPDFERVFNLGYRATMARANLHRPADLAVRRIGGRAELEPLLHSSPIPINSDYFPYVDLNASRSRFMRSAATDLSFLSMQGLPYMAMLAPQRQLGIDLAQANYDRFFSRAEFAWRAGHVAAYLFDDSYRLPAIIPDALQQALAILVQQRETCDRAPGDAAWLSALFELALAVNPYLRPDALDKLWARLGKHPCSNSWSQTLRAWHSLFRSAAQQDAAGMKTAADALLNQPDGIALSDEMQSYLGEAAMLANIALGDRGAAIDAMQRVPEHLKSRLAYRLLAGHIAGF